MENRYEETARILNDMASVKMAMNSHKGKIESNCEGHIIQYAFDEMRELEQALKDGDLMHVIEEAADVQNFLIALVQKKIEQYRSRK